MRVIGDGSSVADCTFYRLLSRFYIYSRPESTMCAVVAERTVLWWQRVLCCGGREYCAVVAESTVCAVVAESTVCTVVAESTVCAVVAESTVLWWSLRYVRALYTATICLPASSASLRVLSAHKICKHFRSSFIMWKLP